MSITMYDTITIDTVPPNPPAVAGYVGGSWPTYTGLVAKFPKAHHLSIAVNASEDADCLDCEPGDATPQQVAGWFKRQQSRGVSRPCVYMSVSSAMTVLNLLSAAGVSRSSVRLWTAHYTMQEHLCGPQCGFGMTTTADATQWTDKALGRNLDQSVCQDSFFGSVPKPPPADPNHYQWFDSQSRMVFGLSYSERATVIAYDKLRASKNPSKTRLGLLRTQAFLLAGRLATIGHADVFHRDWRRRQLELRAQGKRVV